jgi:hypothetical protein
LITFMSRTVSRFSSRRASRSKVFCSEDSERALAARRLACSAVSLEN